MKRTRAKTSARLPREAEKLVFLAESMATAGSRVERDTWQISLTKLSTILVRDNQGNTIVRALDSLYERNLAAFEILNASIEACAESCLFEHEGKPWIALLISVPVVAWSRYGLPSGALNTAALSSLEILTTQLNAHVLANNVRLQMSPHLFSIDQIPKDFTALHQFMLSLAQGALGISSSRGQPLKKAKLEDTIALPADSRFLMGVAVAPIGEPHFRWQELEKPIFRAACVAKWEEVARPHFAKLLPGSEFECLLPDAFFFNVRNSEKRVRPLALRAGVAHIESMWKTDPKKLTAIVAGVGETRVDEYRIGYSVEGETDIIDGTIWPLIDDEEEDDTPAPRDQIVAILRDCKVGTIITPENMFRPEACEDCGAPFFANSDSDMVHVELPEGEEPAGNAHFH